jgi:putative effector of murein hydrolase
MNPQPKNVIAMVIVVALICVTYTIAAYRNYENSPEWNKDFLTMVQLILAYVVGQPSASLIADGVTRIMRGR